MALGPHPPYLYTWPVWYSKYVTPARVCSRETGSVQHRDCATLGRVRVNWPALGHHGRRTGLDRTEAGTGWAGWAAGAERSRVLDSSWTDPVGPRQQAVNSDLSDHLLTYSLTLPTVRQSCPLPPKTKRSTVDTTWKIRTHTVRTLTVSTPTSLSQSQSPSNSQSQSKSKTTPVNRACCPHRLTPTFTYSGRAVLFFRQAQWFLLFLPPYPPLSIPHTCPLLLDLNDNRPALLFFFFIAPLPVIEPRFRGDRLLFIFSPLIVRTRPAFVLALAAVVSVSHNDAPSGPPPSDQPVSCTSGSSNLTCPTAVSGFGPPVPR